MKDHDGGELGHTRTRVYPFQCLADAVENMTTEALRDYSLFGEYMIDVSADGRTIKLLNEQERNLALIIKKRFSGRVVKLADALGLEPSEETHGGSTPSTPTKRAGVVERIHNGLKNRRLKKLEGASPSFGTKSNRTRRT